MARVNWKKAAPGIWLAAYWVFALLYWEGLLHKAVFGSFEAECLYAVGFSVSIGLALTLVVSFLRKGRFAVNVILSLVLAVFYGSQLVYRFIFGTLYSVAMAAQGGEAMTSFWRELLSTMGEKWLWLACLFVPLAALWMMKGLLREPVDARVRLVLLALVLAGSGTTRYAIASGGDGMCSDES